MEPKFISKAKITKQGQLTLPQEARRGLNIDTNSEVYWYQIDEMMILVKDLVKPEDLMDSVLKKEKAKSNKK